MILSTQLNIPPFGAAARIIGKTVRSRCSPRYRNADCVHNMPLRPPGFGKARTQDDAEPVDLPEGICQVFFGGKMQTTAYTRMIAWFIDRAFFESFGFFVMSSLRGINYILEDIV